MAPRRDHGLVSSLALATALTLVLMPSATLQADTCPDVFSSTGAEISGINEVVTIDAEINELEQQGAVVYTLSWNEDCIEAPQVDDTEFTQYFSIDDTQKCSWTVSVKSNLTGVPDYNPVSKEKIVTTVTFSGFTSFTSDCTVTLNHKIIDANTQTPTAQNPSYSLDIAENYAVGYTITNFRMEVSDTDRDNPNNQFKVNVEGCPLQATEEPYTGGSSNATVEYKLTDALNYEVFNILNCKVKFQDFGSTTALSSEVSLTLNVKDVDDEPPVFEYNFYHTEVLPSIAPGETLPMEPDYIHAYDGDTELNTKITYNMEDAQDEVNGMTYFAMDQDSGNVSLITNLDNSILAYERITFFITARKSSGMTAFAVLEVTLPQMSTTTDITTSPATCPECTCPTISTTDFTCPECPTTATTEDTSTPCPTISTTDFTCPECPTTATTEDTSTPCPTISTTDFTCPECPTTATTEDTPCPTLPDCPTTPTEDTSTECPAVSTDPTQPGISFKQASYVGDIFTESSQVFQVELQDNAYSVTFGWSEENEYFDIAKDTGWITTKPNNPPPIGLYTFTAVAEAEDNSIDSADAQVSINVKPTPSRVAILDSVIRTDVFEGDGEEDLEGVSTTGPVKSVCVVEAEPSDMKSKFSVQNVNGEWRLKKVSRLNFEDADEIILTLQAYESQVDCSRSFNTYSILTWDMAVAIIKVKDQNNQAPEFIGDANTVVAYPTNPGLQRAVGPVVTMQATDNDTLGQLTYSLDGVDAAKFSIDEKSGAVYELKFDCVPQCVFDVTAFDGANAAEAQVKVLPLDMNQVSTISLSDVSVSNVDGKLRELSEKLGVQITKLYVSPDEPAPPQMRATKDDDMNILVHVYSIKNGELMSREDLSSAISGLNSGLEAIKFADEEIFESQGQKQDTTGLTVAVAILGALLGLLLIAGLGFFVSQKRKKGGVKKPSTPINTLGQVYREEEEKTRSTPSSVGHKSNGSLNGFTSVQVHSDKDSPPLHRSALASSMESSSPKTNQQRGGLRRINPGSPEYYGYSTPAPPPSFDVTTTSSSSSSPIYAEIKKPKDPKPAPIISAATTSSSSSAFPSSVGMKSSSSSRPVHDVPLSVFPNSQTEKPADPVADYEDVAVTRFTGLKSSPPPRRSTKKNENDSEEVSTNGVTYPGGKNFKEGLPAEEEKKSVAFKIVVDTKVIEPENMGPAQKRAEAEKIMEENRKKLKDENEDDDEDEECEKL